MVGTTGISWRKRTSRYKSIPQGNEWIEARFSAI